MNKNVGRPRSQAADDAILNAAVMMFYKKPFKDVSMEAIAAEAKVSKATLYRRWPNKSSLAVEVLVRVALAKSVPFEGETYKEHLTKNLKALRDMLSSDYADVIVSVIAESQHDRQLRQQFSESFLQPVQALGDADLDKAIASGEIGKNLDKDLLFDQIFGFFYYRLLVAHREVSDEDIELIIGGLFAIAAA